MSNEIEERLILAMPRIAIRLQNELILVCPVDKGILRNSIRVSVSADGKSLIISMVVYGKYVEFGVPPHVIKPKDKQALKFKIGKKELIRKEVKHPGSRPNPFIRNTLQTKLANIIKEEIMKV